MYIYMQRLFRDMMKLLNSSRDRNHNVLSCFFHVNFFFTVGSNLKCKLKKYHRKPKLVT